ncbi:hypothetical protein [Phytopseudomonas dryadis]|uniref:hypothetical protein n=1 Tax=Phytopseudomonas dryadis TaxID=2487520 RepID=UPI001038493C|nr:hypothetical protein [Pseudomonas dryadis]
MCSNTSAAANCCSGSNCARTGIRKNPQYSNKAFFISYLFYQAGSTAAACKYFIHRHAETLVLPRGTRLATCAHGTRQRPHDCGLSSSPAATVAAWPAPEMPPRPANDAHPVENILHFQSVEKKP